MAISVVIFLSILMTSGAIAGGLAMEFYRSSVADVLEVETTSIYDLLGENSYILDREGEVLERIEGEEQRIIVDLEQIPEAVRNAFIAMEDERFYDHDGLDYKRIVGAAWQNFRTGSMQGGSTITQQLAKNLFLTMDQTLTRKVQDAYLAMKLEDTLTKDEILEAYLNTINMGGSFTVWRPHHRPISPSP